jgi:Uma2 family endonuclease
MSTLIQTQQPIPARETLPTMYDLPSEEIGEPGMPDEFHAQQGMLLSETFQPPAYLPARFFAAIDMNLYYDARRTKWYKRPDWFGVVGISRLYEGRDSRLSYIPWKEGRPPLIVVELLSPDSDDEDLGTKPQVAGKPPRKWDVYERILRVPYYAVYGRLAEDVKFFRLKGERYKEVRDHGGHLWIEEAGLGLGLWLGEYNGLDRWWLRWYDDQGAWILNKDELAEQEREEKEQERREKEQERREKEQERREKEQERREKEQERARADRLAEMLRQLGQDPDRS